MNADSQPVLHNCGPSPSAVFRTAPVGHVRVLDLFGELRRSTMVPRSCRASFTPYMPRYGQRQPVPDRLPPDESTPDTVVKVVAALVQALPPLPSGEAAALHLPGHPSPSRRRRWGQANTPFTEDDALQALRQLAAHLAALDCLIPVYGLVAWAPRVSAIGGVPVRSDRLGEPLPWLPTHGDEHDEAIRLAWTVCACSYAAPPLVLFHRVPSLRFWRGDGVLQVRWLGASEVRA